MFDEVFAGIASGFAAQFGGPFGDGILTWPGTPVEDEGGSIVTPGEPVRKKCQVQVSAPDKRMREEGGFIETDVQLNILRHGLDRVVDTKTTVDVLTGPHKGAWTIESIRGDSVGIGYVCRGRKA